MDLLQDPVCVAVKLYGVWVKQRRLATGGYKVESLPPFFPLLTAHEALHHIRWTGEILGTLMPLTELCIARQLESVMLELTSGLPPDALPELARLVAGDAKLVQLDIEYLHAYYDEQAPLFSGYSVEPLCAALRLSHLEQLSLCNVHLWHSYADASALLAALTNHPTLEFLNVAVNAPPDAIAKQAAGASLAKLLAATGRISTLVIRDCRLGDTAMRSVFEALALNTCLRSFYCANNDISRECARDHILPAVQANTSLTELQCYDCVTVRKSERIDGGTGCGFGAGEGARISNLSPLQLMHQGSVIL
jgi:hypothetical protein